MQHVPNSRETISLQSRQQTEVMDSHDDVVGPKKVATLDQLSVKALSVLKIEMNEQLIPSLVVLHQLFRNVVA